MKRINLFFKKNNLIFIFAFLSFIYLCLAFKNPFKTNNLISNLEPPPDVFYYSVPAWNLAHGIGFKMEAFGIEIVKLSTPLYSFYLSPFFLIFNEVRSYYFANLLLCFASIFLFFKLIEVFLGKKNWFLKFGLGLVLVTNFYFYNLPTLLMAENILIPLTLAAAILSLKKLDLSNFILSLVVMGLLAFTKMSSYPVVLVMGVVLLIKVIKSKFIYKIPKKLGLILGILFLLITSMAFIKIVLPGLRELPAASNNFSVNYIQKTLPIFLKEFIGIDGSYLWYGNQQLEKVIGLISLLGMFLGLILKKYRKNVFILMSIIFGVTLFHSMMSYPEGRYISTVIPLFLLFSGIILNELKYSLFVILFLGMYFLTKGTVNGFYERKATSLKRQALNNRLEENEVPWNYKAIESINDYFKDKKGVYLGTLINPFYVMFFGNGNYNFLPLSKSQEFSGLGKGFIDKYFEKDKTVVDLYKDLLIQGKELYVTNYYLTYYKGNLDGDYYSLEKVFKFTQVKEGCLGECKIYKLELKAEKLSNKK